MVRPRSIFGTSVSVLREPGKRRIIFVALIAACSVLAFFPEKYRAAASLTPSDPASLGLSGTLGQLGAVNSVFGNQAAIEVTLKIARSQYVRGIVTQRLNLTQRLGEDQVHVDRWLSRKVDVTALRGGIIQFETTQRDPEFARQLVAAYGEAVRAQMSVIARNQTAYKRRILLDLVEQSDERLARAQSAYDTFRLSTRYSSPQAGIASAGDRVPQIEGNIRSMQIELNSARRFATESNPHVQQIEAQLATLQQQLAQAKSLSSGNDGAVGKVVGQSTEFDRLKRELGLSQSLYDNYKRFLQGTSVEDLASTANVRILEPAYVDDQRQINLIPAASAALLLLILLTIEFYLMRPPLQYAVGSASRCAPVDPQVETTSI